MNKENTSKTILVILVGFSLLSILFKSQILFYIGTGIGLASLISKSLESLIILIWFKIAEVLGWINTHILLSLIFFIFLTPIALLKKVLSRKDPLKLKSNYNSTYVSRDHTYVAKDLKNIW